VNGVDDGLMLEAAAGLLDEAGEHPEEAVRREVAEETGAEIGELEFLWKAYMSPGSVTEHLFFYAAPYTSGQGTGGGGVADEGEDIEVVELSIDEALAAIGTTIVDAKTIMLLQWIDREGRLKD
jgi:nudix-type nucleoside diphosphatase (YffH/AdpP family)